VLSFRRFATALRGDPTLLSARLVWMPSRNHPSGSCPLVFGWWTEDGVWLPMGIDSRDQRECSRLCVSRRAPRLRREQRCTVLHREFAKANPTGYPRDEFATTLTNYLDITVAMEKCGRVCDCFWERWVAAADRLRECCEPAACAGDVANAGNWRRLAVVPDRAGSYGSCDESVLVSLVGGLLDCCSLPA